MTRKNRPDAPTQSALYAKIKDDYNFDEKLVASTDYFLVDHIDGIDYYSPNDEDWGDIIAMCHEHQLAVFTTFYEMDDMASPDSGYNFVVVGNSLQPADHE